MIRYISVAIGVLILGLLSTIHLKNNKIDLLESELKNKNNEVIKEIEICNNSKELDSLKRQNEEFKRIFDDAIVARKRAEKQLEEYEEELKAIEYDFNAYKNKDIKCLNESVDKNYLKTIKGAINGKK
jgi:hypothetical protein